VAKKMWRQKKKEEERLKGAMYKYIHLLKKKRLKRYNEMLLTNHDEKK